MIIERGGKMPHIQVEYSANIQSLDTTGLLSDINQALIATGVVQAQDLKSRITMNSDYLIGLADDEVEQAYIHVQLSILSGRTDAEKAKLQDQVLMALQRFKVTCPKKLQVQLSSELIEMSKVFYRKAVVEIA